MEVEAARSEKRRHESDAAEASEKPSAKDRKTLPETLPSNNVTHMDSEDSKENANTYSENQNSGKPSNPDAPPSTDLAADSGAPPSTLAAVNDVPPHASSDDPTRPARGYEYCDHTADIQVHAWGPTLKDAFEECCVGMFGYMTEIGKVEARDTFELEAEGHDMESLLYNFLDEWLYAFSVEPYFICNEISITHFDEDQFKIKCEGYGEPFDLGKHPQGTEVKAITYSAMQIVKHDRGYDLYVIVDI